MKRRPITDRLNEKIDRSGGPTACWPWTGTTNGRGYGLLSMPGPRGTAPKLAHRIAFELAHGRAPIGCVLHHCDNPPCCNPAHLHEGSQRDNAADRTKRGRWRVKHPGRYRYCTSNLPNVLSGA